MVRPKGLIQIVGDLCLKTIPDFAIVIAVEVGVPAAQVPVLVVPELDSLEDVTILVLRCEGDVLRAVPILRRDNRFEGVLLPDRVYHGYDGGALGHGEAAARDEAVLDVDHDQGRLDRVLSLSDCRHLLKDQEEQEDGVDKLELEHICQLFYFAQICTLRLWRIFLVH